jgi:Domain of unknown function (DUF4203)
VVQNPADKCNFIITATHGAGCPTFEVGAIVQFFSDFPYILALVLVGFGVASAFFGGYVFDWVVASIAGLIVFMITAVLLDAMIGGFSVLAKGHNATFGRVLLALLSFVISGAAAFAAGFFIKKTSDIALGVLGGIGGFFGAFLLYSLVFAKFVTATTWLLWITLFAGVFGGAFIAYKFKQNILIQLTAVVGAYALIRGISLLAGGFPNEMEMMSQMKAGTFVLDNSFYGYLAAIVGTAVAGTIFQYKKGYDKIKNVNGDDAGDEDGYKAAI